jgi:nicotinate-nucleotide adenylyltransferase
MTVGLLTGTFDPVHLGHVELAQAAMRERGLDEVWVLVNPGPAHKAGVAPYGQRLVMVGLAVRDVSGLRVVGDEVTHTMAGFTEFVGKYLGYEFVFVVGMDTMARLDAWDDYEAVVRRAAFAVARRPGVANGAVEGLRARLGALGSELRARVFDFDEHEGASSRTVREQIRAGERPEALDVRVYEYILREGLYRA